MAPEVLVVKTAQSVIAPPMTTRRVLITVDKPNQRTYEIITRNHYNQKGLRVETGIIIAKQGIQLIWITNTTLTPIAIITGARLAQLQPIEDHLIEITEDTEPKELIDLTEMTSAPEEPVGRLE